MKKVLIAVDYDPTAQKVAETGFDLAKSMGAEIILLHVITEPIYYSSQDYSPILGFSGYMDMSPLQLDSIEGLTKLKLILAIKTLKHWLKKVIFLTLY